MIKDWILLHTRVPWVHMWHIYLRIHQVSYFFHTWFFFSGNNIFEQLCLQWLQLLQQSHPILTGFKSYCFLLFLYLITLLGFMFEVIYKSMVLCLDSSNELHLPSKSGRFSDTFLNNLQVLFQVKPWCQLQHWKISDITHDAASWFRCYCFISFILQ